LGYFDDRKREQRMKSSGFVSFVLLNKKPQLVSHKRIGIPLNGLMQLARREIVIPCDYSASSAKYGLIRNHDSLLLSIFNTTKFYHVMNKIKMNRTKNDIHSFSEFDVGYECQICMEILVETKIICENGHSVCGKCCSVLKNIYLANCHICRKDILSSPISNIVLEEIIQNRYPKQYAERYHLLTNQEPITWKNDPVFNGSYVQYMR